jgi:hypothetical protein
MAGRSHANRTFMRTESIFDALLRLFALRDAEPYAWPAILLGLQNMAMTQHGGSPIRLMTGQTKSLRGTQKPDHRC